MGLAALDYFVWPSAQADKQVADIQTVIYLVKWPYNIVIVSRIPGQHKLGIVKCSSTFQ